MTQMSRLVFFQKKNTAKSKSSSRIETTQVSVVIPVKDNQNGINNYLNHFFKTNAQRDYPKEIIIVDNNSRIPVNIPKEFYSHGVPLKLVKCSTPGPAAARNFGVQNSTGEWILFNDSDCIPTSSLISGYQNADNSSVAYAGNVKPLNTDKLSAYYESQEILIPLKIYSAEGNLVPQYLITANALVWKPAFTEAGGFNENIDIAGGEDIDLGLRLSQIGTLAYAFDSIAVHDFSDGWSGFIKRFIRYGKGNRLVAKIWDTDLKPKPFKPNQVTLFNRGASILQFLCLTIGYYRPW
jgi:glycosyltransferase involved in cell wall biosynthesis